MMMISRSFRLAAIFTMVGIFGVGGVLAQEEASPPVESEAVAGEQAAAEVEADEEFSTFDVWMEKLEKGGNIIIMLLILSVSAMAFVLERLANLRRRRIVPGKLSAEADELWRQQDYQGLLELCARRKSSLARIIEAIVQHRENNVEHVQRFADDLGGRELRLELRRAYPLAVIATIAPLLGLLGTVIGMIGAFDTVAVAGSMGDPSLLADDIAKALITTAAGLVVAIPTLGFYHYFRSRTNYFAVLLEEEVNELVSAWFLKRV